MAATGQRDNWDTDELERIGSAVELQLATRRGSGSLSSFVTMWVVRVDHDLYVRSAYGPENPWYRRAKSSGAGRVCAGGVERDIEFGSASDAVMDAIDAAYHAKYDSYGQEIVGHVVGPDAHSVTIRLVPTASTARA